MIGGSEGAVWPANLASGVLEALKSLLLRRGQYWALDCETGAPSASGAQTTYRRGDFVDQVAVNVEENGTVKLLVDDMGLEDLVVKGTGGTLC